MEEKFTEETWHEGHGPEIFARFSAALNLLSERWTLHIVRVLLGGKQAVQRNRPCVIGLNPATLRERLRALEEEEVVTRTVSKHHAAARRVRPDPQRPGPQRHLRVPSRQWAIASG